MPGNDTIKDKPGLEEKPVAEEIPEKSTRPVPTAGAGQGTGRKEKTTYIIAIGIDEYKNFTSFPGNCEKDCKDFVNALRTQFKNFEVYKESDDAPEIILNDYATKKNITDRINSFLKSPFNDLQNNLIIFFSGHGDEVEVGLGKTGCWVPHDGGPKDFDSLIPSKALYGLFERLKATHFLLIADCCNAGSIFKDSIHDVSQANKILGEEPSRFAIVSSRSNEKSKAGPPNENSAFTKILLKALEGRRENIFLMSQLIGDVNGGFIDNDKQKPSSGRFSTNKDVVFSGEYVFYPNESFVKKVKRKRYLEQELRTLNYTNQRKKFLAFKQENYASLIAIFDGIPEEGLRHVASMAKKHKDFPAKNQEIYLIQLPTSLTAEGNSLFHLLNGAFTPDITDLPGLKEYIKQQLKNRHVVFEMRFYNDESSPNSPQTLRDKDKQAIVQQVAEFIAEISQNTNSTFKLFLFVIDEGKTNYMAKFNSDKISGVETLYIPPAESIDVEAATIWYDGAAERSNNEKEFNELFMASIRDKMEIIINETKGYPGNVIRRICCAGECVELAEEILNPK